MHELSVCQALLAQVETVAQQHQATEVKQIILQVGALSGLEPELLQQAFSIAQTLSPLTQHATLQIESLPIRVHCAACGMETTATVNRLICGNCGNWQTQLVSGHELLLKSIDLMTENEGQS